VVHVTNLSIGGDGEGGERLMELSKRKLLLASAIIAVVATGIAYGAFILYSNVVTVHMNFTLSLTETSQVGSVIALTAHLEDRGSPVSGVTVYFYTCDSGGGSRVAIGSTSTDASGDAVKTYSATGNGDLYFIAEYDVP
jgi:hypothetical protein